MAPCTLCIRKQFVFRYDIQIRKNACYESVIQSKNASRLDLCDLSIWILASTCALLIWTLPALWLDLSRRAVTLSKPARLPALWTTVIHLKKTTNNLFMNVCCCCPCSRGGYTFTFQSRLPFKVTLRWSQEDIHTCCGRSDIAAITLRSGSNFTLDQHTNLLSG